MCLKSGEKQIGSGFKIGKLVEGKLVTPAGDLEFNSWQQCQKPEANNYEGIEGEIPVYLVGFHIFTTYEGAKAAIASDPTLVIHRCDYSGVLAEAEDTIGEQTVPMVLAAFIRLDPTEVTESVAA